MVALVGAVAGEVGVEPVSVEWDDDAGGRAVVRLCGDLTVSAIDAVYSVLPDVLSRAASVALDVARLRAVDLAGIQLLIAGRRTAERAGKLFYLVASADGVLREALIAAGLDGEGGEDAGWVDAFWLAG